MNLINCGCFMVCFVEMFNCFVVTTSKDVSKWDYSQNNEHVS